MFSGIQDLIYGTGNDDPIMEQALPKQTAGKQYVLITPPGSTSYGYKLVSSATASNTIRDATTGNALATVNTGGVYPADFSVSIDVLNIGH